MAHEEDSQEEKPEQKPDTITTTIEIEKELFLKFKALCVLKELKISSEIERLIKRRVEELSESTDLPSSRDE
ncbi:MAG TPA: hypothetical protein VJ485_04910 [archaeon]|nr:hypothetical protein [archaeon]